MRQQTELTFDRLSTREELFEALDVLCEPGNLEFARRADAGVVTSLEETPGLAGSSEGYFEGAEDEITSLTEMLASRTNLPN